MGHGLFLWSFWICDCLRVRIRLSFSFSILVDTTIFSSPRWSCCSCVYVQCIYAPTDNVMCVLNNLLMSTITLSISLSSGLDNKVTVYPLSFEDDSTQRKKPVGTHTSYTAYCTFLPNSDYQVGHTLIHFTPHLNIHCPQKMLLTLLDFSK
jgi:hypothetical protein